MPILSLREARINVLTLEKRKLNLEGEKINEGVEENFCLILFV